MSLPNVAQGDLHVQAHNNERALLNAIQNLSDETHKGNLEASYSPRFRDVTVRRRARQSPKLADVTLITRFDAGHGWAGIGNSAAYDLNSNDRPFIGERSLKYIGPSGGAVEFEKTVSLDLTNRTVCVWFKAEDNNSAGAVLFLGDAGYTNYRTYSISGSGLRSDDGWVCIKVNPDGHDGGAGTLNLALVTRMKIRISNTTAAHTIYIGAVGHIAKHPTYPNGAVVIGYDDTADGILRYAAPLHEDYGYPAVQYLIGEWVETAAADHLTVENLHRLQDLGWEVGGHADRLADHVDLTSLSEAQAEDALGRMKEWLVRNGFQGESFAYPHGQNNASVRVSTRKFFSTGRSVSGGTVPPATYVTAPTNLLYQIPAPSFDTAGFTLENMKTAITRARTLGLYCPIVLHTVVSGASSGASIGAADLSSLLDHINTQGIPVITQSQMFEVQP